MSQETIYLVVEQLDGIPSERVRRGFTTKESANRYIESPENVGNLYIESCPLNESW